MLIPHFLITDFKKSNKNDMDGSRRCDGKWSQLVWERQIPYDSTHMQNLRNKTNKEKETKNKILNYRKQTGGCQRGGEWGDG